MQCTFHLVFINVSSQLFGTPTSICVSFSQFTASNKASLIKIHNDFFLAQLASMGYYSNQYSIFWFIYVYEIFS